MSIRVVTEPRIYVVGRQMIDDFELSKFMGDKKIEGYWPDTDVPSQVLVEVAGRCCYRSFSKPRPGGNAAYIRRILESGHGSVLEHAVFSFIFSDVSRSLTHELVRHRAGWGYSMESQRFIDATAEAFVLPPGIPNDSNDEIFLDWIRSCLVAMARYNNLVADLSELKEMQSIADPTLRRKRVREAARAVLPNCIATTIFVTANARALRHFLELRGSAHADAEIRRLALALLDMMRAEAPHLFGDYEVVDGTITTPYRKV